MNISGHVRCHQKADNVSSTSTREQSRNNHNQILWQRFLICFVEVSLKMTVNSEHFLSYVYRTENENKKTMGKKYTERKVITMATNLLQRESLFFSFIPALLQELFTWSTCAATITLVNNCRGNKRNKHALTSWVVRSDLYSSHEKNFARGCHRTAEGHWSANPVEEAKRKYI